VAGLELVLDGRSARVFIAVALPPPLFTARLLLAEAKLRLHGALRRRLKGRVLGRQHLHQLLHLRTERRGECCTARCSESR
jgi:hypothetical protein